MRKSILLLFILLSCSRTSIFRMEGPDDFFKYITDENPNKGNEIKYLNIDLNTNYVFIDFGKWKKYFNKRENNYYWSRNYEIFNLKTNITTSTDFSIYTNSDDKYFKTSYGILKDWGEEYLIYVGKWQYVEKFKNEIRAVATSKGRLKVFFEFKNKDTEKIKYKPLMATKDIQNEIYYEDKEIATIQWFEKYGYNAYVDLKTGEIKQVNE